MAPRVRGDTVTTPSTPSTPIKVIVIDDDALVRSGIGLVLRGDERISVVAEGADGSVALQLLRDHQPDVVLMDLRMPRVDGVAATAQIVTHHPKVKVVVLTTMATDEAIEAALRAGAAGYVLKDESASGLSQAIVDVHEGAYVLSPTITARFVENLTATARSAHHVRSKAMLAKLTERESEVAMAIAQGLTNAEIAKLTRLSLPTVKGHVSSIMNKAGVTNRVQLALMIHHRF